MKSFLEFTSRDRLEEGAIKTGSIITYAARARADGNRAARAYERGKQALRAQTGSTGIDARLDRLENALESLFDGLAYNRLQIGNAMALDVAGHLLTTKEIKRRTGKAPTRQ